jgi:hypothetical protein
MRRVKEVKWKRRCNVCEEVNSAWIEITVKKEGPNKHIVCEPCLTKVLSLEHWGIKIHRIASKWTFPEWIIDRIKVK